MKNPKKRQSKNSGKDPDQAGHGKFVPYLLALGLMVLVFITYAPGLNKEFLNYDDDIYITENQDVISFSAAEIPGLFTHFYKEQYSPIPTLFYGLTHQAGGLQPAYYNFMGILFHLINVFLVFLLAFLVSKKQWISLFIAAVFGLHPVNAEAVSWLAAAYKIGIFSIFFLSSLIFYVRYALGGKTLPYVLSLAIFLASCFSKEQAVVLSVTLPVLDYVLGRDLKSLKTWIEKIPFLVISIIFGILTLFAASQGRDQMESTPFSLIEKLGYGAHALSTYFYHAFVPAPLWLNYAVPDIQVIGMAFYLNFLSVIILVIALVYGIRKHYKYLVAGLLFFLINLILPLLLAIISIRESIVADRYMYLPIIGFASLLAYGVVAMMQQYPKLKPILVGLCLLVLLILGGLTQAQVKTWKNSESMLNNIIKNKPVPMAYVNRSELALTREDFPSALEDCNKALAINGKYYLAYMNRGICYRRMGKLELAMKEYTQAISLNPRDFKLYLNRGNVYFDLQMDSLAIADYQEVLKRDPGNAMVNANLGAVFFRLGRFDESMIALNAAIRLDPRIENAFMNRAILYEKLNKPTEALQDLEAYLAIKPDNLNILHERGRIKKNSGDYAAAITDFTTVITRNPGFRISYVARAEAYARIGDIEKARTDVTQAKKLGAAINPAFERSIGLIP